MDNKHEPARWDVAAYALGILDSQEATRYEMHLAECPTCAAELEYLLPASTLLADVDPDQLRAAEESQLSDRLLQAVRIDRRRSRSRKRLTAAAGMAVAAAVAAFALFAGSTWFPPDQPGEFAADGSLSASSSPRIPPGVGGPDLTEGEEFSATDPQTSLHIDALLQGNDWGTQVSFALSSLNGPRECQLLVRHADGTTRVVASWRVPTDGYGTDEQPNPLLLQAATAVAREDIEGLQVLALEPDGSTTELVNLPV